MYRYFLTREAEREFDNELAYSAQKWGNLHARKYAKELQRKILTIARNPLVYPVRNDILPGIRICTYKGNRIIYTVQEELKQIVILGLLSIYQNINSTKIQKRVP